MNSRSAKSTVTSIDSDERSADNGARAGATPPPEATNDSVEDLERRLQDTAETLKDSARVLGDLASRQIRAHPLAAFGVAFFAGLTAARLLRR